MKHKTFRNPSLYLSLLTVLASCNNVDEVNYEVLNDRTQQTNIYNLTRSLTVTNGKAVISLSIDDGFVEITIPQIQGPSKTIYSSQRDIITDVDTVILSIIINALNSRQSEIATSAEEYVGALKLLYEETPKELRMQSFEDMLPNRESLKLLQVLFYLINGHPFACMRYTYCEENHIIVFQQKLITWFDHTMFTIYFNHASTKGNFGQYVGFLNDMASTLRFKHAK